MMLAWIFIFPATALTTTHPNNSYMAALTSETLHRTVPTSLMTKYAAYPSARLLHTLPCALWVALLPFQLHPWLRITHPVWHKRLGYLFAATGLVLSCGVGRMASVRIMRHIHTTSYFYACLASDTHSSPLFFQTPNTLVISVRGHLSPWSGLHTQ
jgi:hypothetical protein